MTTSLSSTRAICLWIPLFQLRCEERRRLELLGRPLALLSPTDTRRVCQVSHSARRYGVLSGMTVSQAIGLCPTLTLVESDPVHYDEQFTHLIHALENVSPVVEPAELGRVFVGVDGLERLVGNPEQQLAAVIEVIKGREKEGRRKSLEGGEWETVSRLGWAHGKFTAWVAAARAKPGAPIVISDDARLQFLASQPIAVLPVTSDTHRRLTQLGLKKLCDVARLPESALISQFGREGRVLWRRASGIDDDPVTGSVRPEPILATLHFPTPIAERTMLVHAICKLTERALKNPRCIGWRIQSLRVHAILEHGGSWLAEAMLKDPSVHVDHIVAPLGIRLEQNPPTGAVEYLTVEFTSFARGTQELQLFARDAASAARAGRRHALRAAALEIKGRLSRPMLHHIIEVQPWSRIPERRYALIDFEH